MVVVIDLIWEESLDQAQEISPILVEAVSLGPRPAAWAIGLGLIGPCVPVAMAASLVPAAEIALLPCQESSAIIALERVEIGPVPAVGVFNAPRSPVKMGTDLVQVAAAYKVPTFRIVQAVVAIALTGPSSIGL